MLFVFEAAIFRNRAIAGGLALVVSLCFSARGADDNVVDFRPATKVGSFRQAKAIVEVEGKLRLNADGQEVKHLPIKVQGELHYTERVLAQTKQWADVRLIRSYHAAQAKLRLHESDLSNELRTERRLIAIESNSKSAVLFSPTGPLTREELDLIEAPASGLALEGLLPVSPAKIGGQWPLSDTIVARLLGLEAVNQQDVTCTLDSVKDSIAIVSLSGKIAGAVGGVTSDIDLKGKLNFDTKLRAITWLTLAYKENRAIGHAQPGFEVVTKLRMVSTPTQPLAELSDKVLAGLSLQSDAAPTLIELNADAAGFQLSHDRRWSVMLDRADLTVLRFVDRGDLITQCNITRLPPLAKDQQLSMDSFQTDVKRVLGKNFEEIVEATEEQDGNGLRGLRVVVAGKVGELSIQWTYYHLSDDLGHRVSLVFTIESNLLDRFSSIDRELVANFRFIEGKQPTPAEPAAADAVGEAARDTDNVR